MAWSSANKSLSSPLALVSASPRSSSRILSPCTSSPRSRPLFFYCISASSLALVSSIAIVQLVKATPHMRLALLPLSARSMSPSNVSSMPLLANALACPLRRTRTTNSQCLTLSDSCLLMLVLYAASLSNLATALPFSPVPFPLFLSQQFNFIISPIFLPFYIIALQSPSSLASHSSQCVLLCRSFAVLLCLRSFGSHALLKSIPAAVTIHLDIFLSSICRYL